MKLTKLALIKLINEAMGIAEEESVPADALDVAGQVAADEVIDDIYYKISSTMRNWIDSNSRPIEDKDLPDVLEQIKLDTEELMLDLGRTMGEEPELDEPEDLHRSALQKRGSYEELEEPLSLGSPKTDPFDRLKPRSMVGKRPIKET